MCPSASTASTVSMSLANSAGLNAAARLEKQHVEQRRQELLKEADALQRAISSVDPSEVREPSCSKCAEVSSASPQLPAAEADSVGGVVESKLSFEFPRSRIHHTQFGIDYMSKTIGELKGEMSSLRQENAELSAKFRKLKTMVTVQEHDREWDAIAIVEQHYRDLEQHRCRNSQDSVFNMAAEDSGDEGSGLHSSTSATD